MWAQPPEAVTPSVFPPTVPLSGFSSASVGPDVTLLQTWTVRPAARLVSLPGGSPLRLRPPPWLLRSLPPFPSSAPGDAMLSPSPPKENTRLPCTCAEPVPWLPPRRAVLVPTSLLQGPPRFLGGRVGTGFTRTSRTGGQRSRRSRNQDASAFSPWPPLSSCCGYLVFLPDRTWAPFWDFNSNGQGVWTPLR